MKAFWLLFIILLIQSSNYSIRVLVIILELTFSQQICLVAGSMRPSRLQIGSPLGWICVLGFPHRRGCSNGVFVVVERTDTPLSWPLPTPSPLWVFFDGCSSALASGWSEFAGVEHIVDHPLPSPPLPEDWSSPSFYNRSSDPHQLRSGFPVAVSFLFPPPGKWLRGPHLLSSDDDEIILQSLGVLLLAPSPLLQPTLRAVLHISACAFVALATPAGELAVERIDVSVVCFWSLDLL
jgi:hypothetical protein